MRQREWYQANVYNFIKTFSEPVKSSKLMTMLRISHSQNLRKIFVALPFIFSLLFLFLIFILCSQLDRRYQINFISMQTCKVNMLDFNFCLYYVLNLMKFVGYFKRKERIKFDIEVSYLKEFRNYLTID